MARRRSQRTALAVYRAPAPHYSAPRPIVIRAPAPVQRRRRRRSGGGGSLGGLLSGGNSIIAIGVASAAIGLAETSGLLAKLPAIPLIGRKGALAIAAYYYSKHGGGSLARDVCIAAAALAGNELGRTGAVSGDD